MKANITLLKKQIAALEKSITHWTEMRNYPHKLSLEPSSAQCACCVEFIDDRSLDSEPCENCPVFEHTGETMCSNTPYGEARRALKAYRNGYMPLKDFVSTMNKEIYFLRSLLHKKQKEYLLANDMEDDM